MDLLTQIVALLILAIPVAWASWTVTHEDIFHELRDYCSERSEHCQRLAVRKFFYVFTCEYCFSHWVALVMQLIFQLQLIYVDWRGYFVGYVALVWLANIYMNLYHRVRVGLRKQRAIANKTEKQVEGREAA
jgi:hypothetical protein